MSSLDELKEVCLRIVGHWKCEQMKQEFIFYFSDKLLKMAKLHVINSTGKFDTEYGIGIDISRGIGEKTNFYFDIGAFEKRYFSILNLTDNMLIIEEQLEPRPAPSIYKKVIDSSFAEDILRGLDSTEPTS